MQEVIVQQEEQPVEIALDQSRTDSIVLPGSREDRWRSLSWLLGARGRFVLTSERPNKKRKLLGADAGLEQLVLLPSPEGEAGSVCDVCCLGESDMVSNRMLHCKNCEISVHQKCYGVHVVPDRFWFCVWCTRNIGMPRRLTRSDACRTVLMPCVLCPKEKGALKPFKRDPGPSIDGGNQEFVHLFCSLWRPEFYVEDMESMEPVTNVVDTQENQSKLVCSLCKVMHGACVRCSHGACRTSFHPICAREFKLQIEIWGKFGHDNVEMRAFCAKHSSVKSISSIQNDKSVSELDSAQVELHDGKPVTGKEQQVRFTRSNKDKFVNSTITTSSCSLNEAHTNEVATISPVLGRTQETQSADMAADQPSSDGNLMSDSGDVSGILRKLVDQGKISLDDIELEPSLRSESVEAAFQPETTAYSPGLKLKMIKWLQNSECAPSVQVKSFKEGSLAQGTLPRSESKNLTTATFQSGQEEAISSIDHHFLENDNANNGDLVQNGFHRCPDPDVNQISGRHLLNMDGYCCYIHPIIEKRLQGLWSNSLEQTIQKNGYHEELSWSLHDEDFGGSSTKLVQLTGKTAMEVCKAQSSDTLKLSPDDEIEGEIVYLQSRLLDGVVSMKQRYEDLILKVVQNISYELDSFNKRKWDHIIVNQFLRDLREAKKRGNSERRHKEALAILAATAPSVTPTSRNTTVRKETENNVTPAKRENMPRSITGSSRIGQLSSSPQAKDLSFSNSDVSDETNFGIFNLAKFSKKSALPCDICMRCDTILNRIFVCSSCKATVHLDCYQSLVYPTGPWKCELCHEMPSDSVTSGEQSDQNGPKACLVQCGLCHGTSGAFRKTVKGQWVHAFCAEWLLETTFRRGQHNPVDGMERLHHKDKDTCSICHRCVGACLKCCTLDCQITFHPSCARDAGLYMNTKRLGNMLQHKAYCCRHSIEQRKAYSQQYGPDEIKGMKQMRVELELLRFLCERIVKREKVKKDLVGCAHDILAARRITAVSSLWTSCYTSGPGASSESATTSVNNKSYGGTIQRSDDVTVRLEDVTVDSTVTKKHTVRFSLHNRDTDRNTADSSTSTISYKRKLDDGESLAFKSHPGTPATALLESRDAEKPIDKKLRDMYQKELVMVTSHQALLKNKTPPERYVYTRRSSMSKRKQCSQHVVQRPGG
ncbi:uncharacterized protein [Zea mays]|nr:uncharacterized protein LOC100279001 isoform X1 [Zea mays]AQK83122.1 Putative PHD-finger domain containing protein family [Zea mays]AQK83126.1 Putative PHD-finger domain containing protein family [Zea mays]AQK83127.1 Putative PHD-finger domain containing protein family [Zea mays]AQK83128.1 Putative PHD-finger domain containing protein family [Zea mays]AQK83130.1 Putative PHD-finger domain containing protein family [Zea mays]|eukprot:XP_020394484.1 uncharacterized protein LOC100279001 isoform X1 [Zea mays]